MRDEESQPESTESMYTDQRRCKAGGTRGTGGGWYTVNIYMYKIIEARVNTVAIPTTGKSCSLYRELLKPL